MNLDRLDGQHQQESPELPATGVPIGETVTRKSNATRQMREAELIIRQFGRPVPLVELYHELIERGVEVGDKGLLIPEGSRPGFRDDGAHHSEMISPTVPK